MIKMVDLLKAWGNDDVFIIRTKHMTVKATKSILLSEKICESLTNMTAFNVIVRQSEDGEDIVYVHAEEEEVA